MQPRLNADVLTRALCILLKYPFCFLCDVQQFGCSNRDWKWKKRENQIFWLHVVKSAANVALPQQLYHVG